MAAMLLAKTTSCIAQYYGILGLGLVLLGRRRRIIIGYRVGYTLDLHKARFKTTSHNDT